MHINDLLKLATERGASDLHIKVSSYPVIRVNGKLMAMTDMKRMMQEDTINMAFSIMSARQKQRFKEDFEIDMAYSVPGLGRFRCNIFQQRGAVGLVLRVIPVKILGIRDLALPTQGAGNDRDGTPRAWRWSPGRPVPVSRRRWRR